MENFCTVGADRIEPGESNGSCVARVFLDRRYRRSDHNHAGRAEDHSAVCQEGSGPQDVWRPDTIHAFESELRRRDADHFRLGAASFSSYDCSVRIQRQPYG